MLSLDFLICLTCKSRHQYYNVFVFGLGVRAIEHSPFRWQEGTNVQFILYTLHDQEVQVPHSFNHGSDAVCCVAVQKS